MKSTWRYIESDGVAHSTGLAADEWLMTAGEPVLRLYTYRSHCALVGKFQNLEAEIDLDFCREADIGVNRRPTGGGAILMGEGQLGIAVIHSSRVAGVPQHPKEIFARYGRAIMAGLERLGVRGDLEAKNDIRVAGRKIAGLGVCRDESGTFLFHTSLLVDLDVDLMLRVLKIPAEKISDKLRARVADNLTTVRREVGRPMPMAEVREAIREGFAAAEGVRFERRDVSTDEMDGVRRLEEEKYLQPSWVDRRVPSPDTNGRSIRKTPQGLLRLYLALAGEHIKDIAITGDFAEDEAVGALEKRLASARADESVIRDAVSAEGLPADFAAAILDAVADARRSNPYGCFLDAKTGSDNFS